MPSVVHHENNKEPLKFKNSQRERQINNRDPYKDREPEVGGHSYRVIFEPIQNVEFSRSVYRVTLTLTVLEMFRDDEIAENKTRQRRFVAELGAFLAGAGAYANYKNIQKIKENN